MTDKDGEVPELEQSTVGLRKMLFETMARLRYGKCTPAEAKAVALLANGVMSTVAMELNVARLRKEYPEEAQIFLPPPIDLAKANG